MDQITHNVRRNQWLNIVNACQSRTDNSTVREWLKANGIAYKSYYYWLRKFRQEAYERIDPVSSEDRHSFAEIPLQREAFDNGPFDSGFRADAVIRINDCVIALSNTASEALLRSILEGLNHAC